ncbi:MAG: hypothetical protein AB1656_04925 [Candidatus Omnitrophota bacterium]
MQEEWKKKQINEFRYHPPTHRASNDLKILEIIYSNPNIVPTRETVQEQFNLIVDLLNAEEEPVIPDKSNQTI